MKPHILELTAFGPFAESERVDFDELADAGLFLLHGDTGAGKSTLLDAISYALFGSVPGARGKNPRLRSDHAAPTLAPQVRLEFSVGDRRLRITRQPAWRRPKQRGAGTTEAKSSVLLEREQAGTWVTLSTRFDEVGEEIAHAVGMTAEQFCQVVLLPQGGFAAFLHASVDDRADLLQKLFGTERFERVEQWLRQRARDLRDALDTDASTIRNLASTIRRLAGDDPDAPLVDPDQAEAVLATAAAEAARTSALTHAADTDFRQASDDHAALVVRLERATTRRDSHAELDRLLADADRIGALGEELARARRATALPAMADAIERAAGALATARTADSAARTSLATSDPALAGLSGTDLVAAATAAAQRVAVLEALRPRAVELEATRAAAQDATDTAAVALDAVTAAEGLLAELAVLAQAAQDNLTAARAATAEQGAAAAHVRDLENYVAQLQEQSQATASATELRTRRDTAAATVLDAREIFLDHRERYLDSLAARLANELVDGEQCPVCGAEDHPHPRQAADGAIDDTELAAAEVRYESARAVVEQLEKQLAAATQRVGSVNAWLAESILAGTGVEAAHALLEAAQHRLATLHNLATGLSEAETTATAIRQEQERANATVVEQRATHKNATATAKRETKHATRLATELAAHLGEHPDFDTAVGHALTIAAGLDAVVASAAEVGRCIAEAERAGNAAERAAEHAGFRDLVDATSAVRAPDVLTALAAEHDAYTAALATTRDRLSSIAADALSLPELTAATAVAAERVTTTKTALDQQIPVQVLAQDRHSQLAALVPELIAALAAQGPRVAELDLVRDLAELTTGDGANHRRMALSSYVLAARLEEVAASATVRLLQMTSGRYELLHADTAPDARRRWGLGLRVRDGWTGEERETGTLSGGETFLASLALALGLADVVTAEAGGSRIDTLFVDEGFGTLDENTLDEVLTVLDGLREGGRMVGLVSHVAELRQRIPTRLEVRKTPTGSTVRRPQVRAA